MASSNMTVTTADKHIPDVFMTDVLSAEEFAIEIAPHVDRSWEFKGFGDTYRKARIPNLTVETKSAGSDLTPKAYTDTEQTISINVHQGTAFAVENIVNVLNNHDLKGKMTGKIGYAFARATDVNLAALFASFSQSVGTLGVELTFDNLLRAVQYLRDAGYKMNDAAWLFSPAQRIALHKMDSFTHASYRGEANAEKSSKTGDIQMFMNAPIVESNLITSPASGQHDNALLHKTSIALIVALDTKIWNESVALGLKEVVAAEKIYGYSEIDRYSETPENITATDENCVWLKGV